MSTPAANAKISTVVRSQIPIEIQNRNGLFIALMEAYYEYLEANEETLRQGRAVQRAKALRSYQDPDTTIDSFLNVLYKQFLALIPRDAKGDKRLLLKNVKEFYRSRGTEKSYVFLIRLLSNGNNDAEFYYPKTDVLRASTSTWYIQKSLRVLNILYDSEYVTENEITKFYLFNGLKIYGEDSGASAIVDSAAHFYDNGYIIDELTLSSIRGSFDAGEDVYTTYVDDDGVSHDLRATINPGTLASITVREPGYGYSVGYNVPIEPALNSPGDGGSAIVTEITTGSINSVSVLYGGSGYRAEDFLFFTSSSGSGANAEISSTDSTGTKHPNTYIIDVSTISLEANTTLGNTTYTNLNSSNANTTIINAVSTFVYSNTGPAAFVTVNSPGDNYTELPIISAIGNTRIQALGILGYMNVTSRGTGYNVGETLTFTNQIGGHGVAAAANITLVAANGAILNVAYTEVSGFPKGGLGYDDEILPSVSINTANGTNGVIVVDNCLGFGATFEPSVTTIGGIRRIEVLSGGYGYNVAPYINLTQSGSMTANAYANVSLGLYSYPGRYIDDDGQVSSYNFLEDRDYYQNFSYVIRVDESLSRYRKAIMEVLHPAGTALFAEYIEDLETVNLVSNSQNTIAYSAGYYSPNVIHFDGSSYFKTNNQTMGSNSSVGVFSVWIYPERLPSLNNRMHIISLGSSANAGHVSLINTNSANSGSGIAVQVVLNFQTTVAKSLDILSNANTTPIMANQWHHILVSWQLNSSAKCNLYINDVSSKSNVYAGGGNTFARANVVVGGSDANGLSQMFVGDMTELFLTNAYIDIANTTNRRLFSQNLFPVNLSTGLLSNTTVVPVLYFKSNAAFANVNSGVALNSYPIITGTITTGNSTTLFDE